MSEQKPLSRLQQKVLQAFKDHGDMIDERLVNLPEFANHHQSTVWKRRSELADRKFLIWKGEAKNVRGKMMGIWGLP